MPTTTPDRTPEGWGNVAQAYDAHVSKMTGLFAAEVLSATRLQPDARIVDVAAGSGALSLQAARRGARVLATDFAPEMVQQLRERAHHEGLDLDARVMNATALDLPDRAFDAAYSNFGLMFLDDPDAGLKEMRRVLADDGRVGVVSWNKPERSPMFSVMFDAIKEAVPDLPPPPQPPAVFSLADPDDLVARLERAGFRDVEVRQVVRARADDSPEEAWVGLTTSNPVIPGMMAQVGPENADAVHAAFLRGARQHVKDDRVVLEAEAHVATAKA